MTTDLLSTLECQTGALDASGNRQLPGNLPVRTLVDWFLADCAAKNLATKTIAFYRLKLRYLNEAAGDRPINTLTSAQLKLLVSHFRETRDWSVTNTNHFITTIKVFWNFLVAEEVLDANPAKRVEKLRSEQRIPEPFTHEDIQKMFGACGSGFHGTRDRTMLAILFDTGVRLAELTHLQVSDVDLALCQIRVFGKGRKERMLPLSAPVRRLMMKYLTLRIGLNPVTDALWLAREGTDFAEWAFINQFRRIAKRAGVVGAHIHKCRHTFATLYLQSGGHPAHLQRLLGHTTPAMTNRYTHLSDLDAQQDHRQASPLMHLFGTRWKG